ncbi:MAG TPA: alpha/beta hydrolase [Gemmatimonadales bacterium]|jgi:pimeloyl-ACP methyl ester carboxylesterase|nr:alpha/beta hydrolase [Gemmatimonadales bacterium]
MLLLALALLNLPADTAVVRNADTAVVQNIEVARGEILRTTMIGTGKPLVLIPGIFGGAYGYRRITGPLVARGYQTIVIEPLGYGSSSHPKSADYSFTAQTARVARTLDHLGIKRALFVAQSTGAAIAFRLAILRPDLVRGLLSIDGGPAESAATPGMKRAFKLGGGLVKLAMTESKMRHDVRQEIVRNSGDTSWVTDAVIRAYTAGQAADMGGSIDAFKQMSKSKEPDSLAGRLHQCAVPVRLLVGTVPHPSEIGSEQRELLKEKLPNFSSDSVRGSGQFIQEEQPAAVLAAVAGLDQAAR